MLVARARSGMTPMPDPTWGAWTPVANGQPLAPGQLVPNPAPYLQVEFDFSSTDRAATPKLKSFKILHECNTIPG
jgi:hypothetical protein